MVTTYSLELTDEDMNLGVMPDVWDDEYERRIATKPAKTFETLCLDISKSMTCIVE